MAWGCFGSNAPIYPIDAIGQLQTVVVVHGGASERPVRTP
jgi:hypothetical protein